jgi:feruloyl esterase
MVEFHKHGLWGVGALAAVGAAAALSHAVAQPAQTPAGPGTACEKLAATALPNTTITTAEEVAAGAFAVEGNGGEGGNAARAAALYKTLPAFCRVAGVIRPTSDSTIKFETWMPLSGWNQRFQGVGNGGFAGTPSYPAMAAALAAGYATGSTDTGHAAEPGGTAVANWALGHPERIIDFGHRAVHEMTVKSKALVAAYFGNPARYSYWIGCSEGGRQGMGEAQKYPADYDGIVAGAPVFGFTRTQARGLALQKILREDPAAFVPGSKIRMLHQAVLARCDAKDGVKDGVIESPPACDFDPGMIQCKAGDQPDCLTASQVKLMRADYRGPVNPRTGQLIVPGHSVGFELQLGARTQFSETPRPAEASGFWRYFVYDDPKWDGTNFDFDKDLEFAEKKVGGAMNNFDPNLSAFKARGGKLMHYHGWNDPQPSPANSVAYYDLVQKTMGGDTGDFYRLFMVPGMGHCQGGLGTDQFDKINTIRAWVEEGKAPSQILAEHRTEGRVDKSRPLCPYPQVAAYKGAGDTNVAANFMCAKPS